MLNLWVVRFEDHEVKQGWLWASQRAQDLHRNVVTKAKEVMNQAKPVVQSALVVGAAGLAIGLEVVANASADAHDALVKYTSSKEVK